jgi:hypothetical protein
VQRTGIAPEELAAWRARLLEHAGARVVLFDQAYIQYYTCFNLQRASRRRGRRPPADRVDARRGTRDQRSRRVRFMAFEVA